MNPLGLILLSLSLQLLPGANVNCPVAVELSTEQGARVIELRFEARDEELSAPHVEIRRYVQGSQFFSGSPLQLVRDDAQGVALRAEQSAGGRMILAREFAIEKSGEQWRLSESVETWDDEASKVLDCHYKSR